MPVRPLAGVTWGIARCRGIGYPESQVAQTHRPLHPQVAHNSLEVHWPLAFQLISSPEFIASS